MRFCQRQRDRGQVLIFAVIVATILLFMAFFLFDLQSMVRLRARSQHGVDAAVLSAAAWQGRSLNTIGELNLLKASLKLITDVDPTADDSLEGLLESVQLLSDMQVRISYAGPMIGVATAQQAAKNNGLRTTETFTGHWRTHFDEYIAPGGVYEATYPPYQGYDWLPSYQTMVEQAIANGVACQFVNNRYLSGLPQLIGNGSDFLMDVGFYSAVHSNHYCWFYRRGISYSDRYDFSLIELDQNLDDYFPGSEFLPLYVRFAASAPHIESNAMLLDRGFDLLDSEQEGYDQITWGLFEDNVAGKAWDDTGDYNFVNSFLRSDFKESYTYGGAAARAILQAKPSLILGSPSWRYGEETADDADTLGDALSFSEEEIQGGSFESYGERLSAAEERMRSLSEAEMVKTSAAAKAFGHLDETTPPHAAGVVLPVFTDVRLIPASLIKANSTDRNPEFMMFLIEYFGHPSYPAVPSDIRERYAYFISAIERFDDNASGFRTGWLTFDAWRASWMAGPDGVPGNADDRQDPCHVSGGGGGGGGGGSSPGPPILH
jgi:hypothetical protein